jgi:hypothetical protein
MHFTQLQAPRSEYRLLPWQCRQQRAIPVNIQPDHKPSCRRSALVDRLGPSPAVSSLCQHPAPKSILIHAPEAVRTEPHADQQSWQPQNGLDKTLNGYDTLCREIGDPQKIGEQKKEDNGSAAVPGAEK